MPRIAITRTADQLASLQRQAKMRGIEIVSLPIITTRPYPFLWPVELDEKTPDWVLFSSANAVNAYFSRLRELAIELPEDTRFGAVGEKTAEPLRAKRREVSFLPSEAYGQRLFEEFISSRLQSGESVMYARAREISYDPHVLFNEHAVPYYPVISYETIVQAVDPSLVSALAAGDVILFTAPSAVRAYQEKFGRPVARPLAIGHVTAAEMNRYGWTGVSIMSRPHIDDVLEYV